MMTEAADPLQDGLVFEARMPLAWRVVDDFPSEAELVRQNADNEDLLRTFSVIEQTAAEHGDEPPELAQELARLDAKLNLVLELLGEVLARQAALPEPTTVRLGARGLEWPVTDPPPTGSRVVLDLYPHPRLPRPLRLHGVIAHVQAERVQAVFHGMSDAARDWLEKLIFRHHRRAVAQSRTHRDPPEL